MFTAVRHRLIGGLAMVAALAAGCGGSALDSDPDTLVFGMIPYDNSTSLAQNYRPLVDLLARETGKKVKAETLTDYAGLIEGQRAGTIHIGLYGAVSYVLARDSGAGIAPVGVAVVTRGAKPGYHAYLVAKAGRGVRHLSDLRGKRVCFVDAGSTSGRLYPEAALLQAGLREGDYSVKYAGGHDASALAVKDGDCDAGAVNDAMFDKILPSQGEIEPDDFVKIWTSETIAGSPLAVSEKLTPSLRRTISKAVLERGNADALHVKDLGGLWGFVPVTDSAFDPIRKVCKTISAEVCRSQGKQ